LRLCWRSGSNFAKAGIGREERPSALYAGTGRTNLIETAPGVFPLALHLNGRLVDVPPPLSLGETMLVFS